MRIFIEKNDSAEEIVEKISESEEDRLVLVIPKNAEVRKNSSAFRLIRKESDASSKAISIESVDDEVLELARESGLEAVHPFFSDSARGAMISDIVPVVARRKISAKELRDAKGARKITPSSESEEETEAEEKEEEVLNVVSKKYRKFTEDSASESRPSGRFDGGNRRRMPGFFKIAAALILCLVVLGGGAYVFHKIFYKASISVGFKKSPWEYEGRFLASKTLTAVNIEDNALPAEVFRMPKNITQFFRASGKQEVVQKAAAIIKIYNAYSSEPQTLVATTRFAAPDGKVFRLNSQILVPGAQIKDGQIVPSSVEAAATADKPGPAYNIGPVERLNIPGFKGSPKYNGFYGMMPEAAKGGFIGEKSVPTDADITAAKAKTSEILKKVLEDSLALAKPDGFSVLNGASDIKINKLVVNKNTDTDGNFSILGEAELNTIAIQEVALRAMLEAIKNRNNPNTDFSELKMDYSEIKPDFAKGQVSFLLNAQAILQPAFSADSFKKEILGKKLLDVRNTILSLPDLEEAKISLWPFYAGYAPDRWKSMPVDAGRINITVK